MVNGFYIVYKRTYNKKKKLIWLPHFLVDGDWSKDDYFVDDPGFTSDCCISQEDIERTHLTGKDAEDEINETLVQMTFDRWINIEQNRIGLVKRLLTNDFVNRSRFGEIKI